MEFLIIRPADAQPQPRQFDGPVSLALALTLMIEGPAEPIPGFASISWHGLIRRCAAYSAENAKKNGQPVNTTATALWHAALKRRGLERGLRRSDGTIADWLMLRWSWLRLRPGLSSKAPQGGPRLTQRVPEVQRARRAPGNPNEQHGTSCGLPLGRPVAWEVSVLKWKAWASAGSERHSISYRGNFFNSSAMSLNVGTL